MRISVPPRGLQVRYGELPIGWLVKNSERMKKVDSFWILSGERWLHILVALGSIGVTAGELDMLVRIPSLQQNT